VLLPIYGRFKSDYGSDFLGLYLYDVVDYKVIFLFSNTDNEQTKEAIHYLTMHHCFDSHYEDRENEEIGVILNIDHNYKYDFECYLNGKYSKFSPILKKLIEKQHGKYEFPPDSHKVTPYEMIYPSNKKRKAIADTYGVDIKYVPEDVYDIPNMEREKFLTLNQLKEKYNYGIEQSTVI